MPSELIASNDWGRAELFADEFGLPFIVVTHQACAAKISLYGGQVLHWQPQDQASVFWLSRDSLFAEGQGIRGGIPICWPWFGDIPGAGNHGFARLHSWQLNELSITPDYVSIRLCLQGDHKLKHWPHAFHLTQDLVLGDHFEQSLTVANNSDSGWAFTGALHNYFNISHTHKVRLPDLAGVPYQDKLDDFRNRLADKPVQIDGAVDRIYSSTQAVNIDDYGLNRCLSIVATGSSQWVLWNPGPSGVAAFTDIHAGGEAEFVCLETANTTPITVAPQSDFSWGQRISLGTLEPNAPDGS